MKKIVLSAGGTGGHVFPACALSFELRKKGYYTILITDQRGIKYVNKEFNEVVILPISKLNWKFFLLSPYLFFKCFFVQFKIKKTISFGGYVSLFPMLTSIILLKNFFIVQLDSVVTRLNRFFINYAHKVFYVFPITNFKKFNSNFYLTGAPIRSGFEFSFIKHSKENFVISIIGGSLGSSYWEDLIVYFAESLNEKIIANITLNIQTEKDLSFLDKFKFKSLKAEKFFDTRVLFKQSHLILTRCGANTLSEIGSIGRPCFLVPWKQAIENHQEINAKNLMEFGGCQTGEYKELVSFFMKLYTDELFFAQTCANISTSFVFDGKANIVSHLS
ncbi:UDP-N-acetylglucosamine--N-acetylmuramyl-(pentapeptide) pyrophosphoryl-undecaprenol N-acetylglucosamine transferase [Alphaproteobacteria bacterium endosymbiont of Tiliacea citrago]|uniref:UDP-N-acetylglucosamine--N-acetylmuramyl- (pentapeptide) pyrophosphoryl-undecaprenol N-acetylglucosamine transferase n=1 Tax=Alphaproteobacteria bacterium endosymbiont of Tiliacea citrago TaxID=3077944 RepID=UPI00313F1D11